MKRDSIAERIYEYDRGTEGTARRDSFAITGICSGVGVLIVTILLSALLHGYIWIGIISGVIIGAPVGFGAAYLVYDILCMNRNLEMYGFTFYEKRFPYYDFVIEGKLRPRRRRFLAGRLYFMGNKINAVFLTGESYVYYTFHRNDITKLKKRAYKIVIYANGKRSVTLIDRKIKEQFRNIDKWEKMPQSENPDVKQGNT